MADKATAGSTGPSWTVQGQMEQTVIGPSGRPLDVMVVTFVLSDGTVGSVQVPVAAYTIANVQAAIAERAAVLDAIGNLQAG